MTETQEYIKKTKQDKEKQKFTALMRNKGDY